MYALAVNYSLYEGMLCVAINTAVLANCYNG